MTAVILAAGLSKRFSGKKLLIDINGKPMIKYVVDLVGSMNFEQKIFIYSDEEVLATVRGNGDKTYDFRFIYNKWAEKGQSTSVKLAAETCLSEGIIFFVGDQPFIDEDTVNKLLKAFHENKGSIIVPVYEGRHGNPVVFSYKWIEHLKNLKGDVGGREIINGNLDEVWEVEIENPQIGLDIDTQEDFYAVEYRERM
jgi:molybdenum cofactor cytidylyltransferase